MRSVLRSGAARGACAVVLAGFALVLAMGRTAGQTPDFGEWTELGPKAFHGMKADETSVFELMSGQPSSIAVDLAHDPSGNTVYVATAGGGVWKSTNGLADVPVFRLVSDLSLPASSGALALDTRSNPPRLFVGTGDPDNPSVVNSYTGNGILVSRDDGAHWTAVESADGGAHPFKGMGISRIVIDPDAPDVMLATTGVGSDANFAHSAYPQKNPAFDHLGIYRSIDAGATWSRVMDTPIAGYNLNGFFHIDLVHEPVMNVFVAGVSQKGLWVSEDGERWRTFTEYGLPVAGLPAQQDMWRISLATRGGTLWLLAIIPSPYPEYPRHELYELAAGSSSWRAIPKPVNLTFKGFLGYVAAPPGSKGLVVGAWALHRTDDITATAPQWIDIEYGSPGSAVALHGDQHAIAFVDADRWYVGDDGGMFATSDRGNTWRTLNRTLRTTEYYSASANAGGSGYVGGQQDNGVSVSADGSAWYQFLLGDGMYTQADPGDPNAFFVSTQFGGLYYLPASAPQNYQRVLDFAAENPSDPNVSGGRGAFLTPYQVLPAAARLYEGVTPPPGFDFSQSRILLSGNTNPWLAAFIPGHPVVTHRLTDTINECCIQYVAPDPQDATTAYVVTGHGGFGEDYTSSLYRLRNIGFAGTASVDAVPKPEADTPDTDVLGHAVMSPTCSESLLVAKVGWVEGRKIFKTTTGGATWTNVSGNLPNVPVHWITLDPVNPDVVYVGTNVGAFVATDGGVDGERWQRLGTGLPNVPVMQLTVSPGRKLLAATYGRGVWTLDLPALAPWTPRAPVLSEVSTSKDHLWPPNHLMVDVVVNHEATDDCGTPACVLSVSSSEPPDGLGDGDVPVDFEVVDAHHVRLRAERSGTGRGRTYTITVTCTGPDGLSTADSTTVFVPHDRR